MRTSLRIGAVALITAASLTATACGGGGGGSAAGGSKELTYWSMWKQGEPQQQVLQASLDAFSKETGIKVNTQWAGREVLKQVGTALNSGKVPDLVDQDGPSLVGALGATGAAKDVSPILSDKASDGAALDSVLVKGLADPYVDKDGKKIVVPYETTGATIWYNAKTNPELKTNPPKTWNEFMAFVDASKSKGRQPIALDTDVPFYDTYWLTHSIIRHGGVGALQKAAADETGQEFKNNPAFKKAAEDLLPLASRDVIGAQGSKWPLQQTGWADGSAKSDLLLMGTWAPSETTAALKQSGKDVASTIDYGSFQYPNVEGGAGNDTISATAIGFSIPAKAKNADAAEQFIKFFLSKDQLSGISTTAANMTSRTDIEPPAELKTFAEDLAKSKGSFLDDDGVRMTAGAWMNDVWHPIGADFFNGKFKSADEFVNTLADKTASFHKSN